MLVWCSGFVDFDTMAQFQSCLWLSKINLLVFITLDSCSASPQLFQAWFFWECGRHKHAHHLTSGINSFMRSADVVSVEQCMKTFGAGMFGNTADMLNGKVLMVCLHLTDQISAKSQTQCTLYTRQAQTHVGFPILLSDVIDGMVRIRDDDLLYLF